MTHKYLSTACYHGKHTSCRLTCKYCEAPCICECHTVSDPVVVSPDVAKTALEAARAAQNLLDKTRAAKTDTELREQIRGSDLYSPSVKRVMERFWQRYDELQALKTIRTLRERKGPLQ